jgi:hypothetical protein
MRYRDFDEELALRRAETGAPVIDLANRTFVEAVNILAGGDGDFGPVLLGGVDPAFSRCGVLLQLMSLRLYPFSPIHPDLTAE